MFKIVHCDRYCNFNESAIMRLTSAEFKRFYKQWINGANNEREAVAYLLDYVKSSKEYIYIKERPEDKELVSAFDVVLKNYKSLKVLSGQAQKRVNKRSLLKTI